MWILANLNMMIRKLDLCSNYSADMVCVNLTGSNLMMYLNARILNVVDWNIMICCNKLIKVVIFFV